MKTATLVVTFAVFTLASAWAQKTPKPKLAELISDKDGGWVSVSGVWRPDNPTKKNALVEAVTELSCFRHGGKDFVGTEEFFLQAMAMSPNGLLDVSTDWLKNTTPPTSSA
jgi:hypothetical protein